MSRILLWVASSVLLAALQSLALGQLTTFISLSSLFCGIGIAWFLGSAKTFERSVNFSGGFGIILSVFILLAGFLQYVYLLVVIDGQYAVGNPNNWGDLPLHINYIRALARGLHFWPENTEFSGEILKYPFGMDLWNALFESLGIPLRAHLFLVGVGGFLLTAWALFRRAGIWGLSAFFLSGGFVFSEGIINGVGWGPGSALDWKNLFLAVFVTQRGFLYALPAGLWLIERSASNFFARKEQLAFGLIWGALVFFHLHSFLILSVYLLGVFLLRKNWRQFILSMAVASAVALPFLFVVFGQGQNLGNAIGFSWGWTFADRMKDMGFFYYLLQNFSGFILVLILSLIAAYRNSNARLEFAFLLALWFLFFNVRVAPWAWDNIKVLLWIYILIQIWFFDHYWQHTTKGSRWQQNLILLCAFAPGVFQLAASFPARVHASKIGPPEVLAECVRKQIGVNDVVIASSSYDHALYFQGMKMALGYEGHVWSHGYDLSKRKAQVQSILNFAEGWPQAAKELDAKWMVRRKNEPELVFSQWDSVAATATECEDFIYDLSQFNGSSFDFGNSNSGSHR